MTERRRALAAAYRRHLPASVRAVPEYDVGHVYHLFPVRSTNRDALQAHLRSAGIETLIHYPIPLPEQAAFAPWRPTVCPVASDAARELLSVPLHPRLDEADLARAAEAVEAFQKGRVPA